MYTRDAISSLIIVRKMLLVAPHHPLGRLVVAAVDNTATRLRYIA